MSPDELGCALQGNGCLKYLVSRGQLTLSVCQGFGQVTDAGVLVLLFHLEVAIHLGGKLIEAMELLIDKRRIPAPIWGLFGQLPESVQKTGDPELDSFEEADALDLSIVDLFDSFVPESFRRFVHCRGCTSPQKVLKLS